MIKKALLTIVGLFAFSHGAYADVSLTLKGIDGALEENVSAYLSSIPAKDYSTSLRFQARLDQSITEALNALGYYHAKISYSIPEGNDELSVSIKRTKFWAPEKHEASPSSQRREYKITMSLDNGLSSGPNKRSTFLA